MRTFSLICFVIGALSGVLAQNPSSRDSELPKDPRGLLAAALLFAPAHDREACRARLCGKVIAPSA